MTRPTQIKFFGCLPPPYPGAAREGCEPTDEKATGWHVVVGGSQASLDSVGDFARFFGTFLELAYAAGVKDERDRLKEKLFGEKQ